MNNEAYYLVDGLTTKINYGASKIVIYTNSKLTTNQTIGTYQIRRENLKPLHKQAKNIASQFQKFNITYWSHVQMVVDDILCEAASNGGTRAI